MAPLSLILFVIIIIGLFLYSKQKGVGTNKALSNWYLFGQKFSMFIWGILFSICLIGTIYLTTLSSDPKDHPNGGVGQHTAALKEKRNLLFILTIIFGIIFGISIMWYRYVKTLPNKNRANLQKISMFFDAADIFKNIIE
tara:strand:+ start:2653 stop:3072 length:420 start_codon:yes stop_codon:yes gene_type:complete